MGNWQLEIFKMAVYMAFPVTSFYVYHQVDWFEGALMDMHRKTRTKETMDNDKEVKEYVAMLRSHSDERFKADLAKMKEELGVEEAE